MPRKSKPVLPRVIYTSTDGKLRLVEDGDSFVAECLVLDALGKKAWSETGRTCKQNNGMPEWEEDPIDTNVLELILDHFHIHFKPLPLSENK